MRRREFIAMLGGAAAAWPLTARAQQPGMLVIGFLAPAAESPAVAHLLAAFRQGLAEAGYVEGKNLVIEGRPVNFRPELFRQAASDLVRLNVNVIFAVTPEAVAAAKNATGNIPVVALDLESDPVAKGYVKSLARPGGNMTGMFLDIPELSGKQLELLREIFPRSRPSIARRSHRWLPATASPPSTHSVSSLKSVDCCPMDMTWSIIIGAPRCTSIVFSKAQSRASFPSRSQSNSN
jgi:putative ABC transport system substrate-binding protein